MCLLQAAEEPVDDLMDLVKQIVPFHVKVTIFVFQLSWTHYVIDF